MTSHEGTATLMASGNRSAAAFVGPRVVDDRPDLTTRSQIHDLVVVFYRELIMDEVLDQVFEEVAEVNWGTHIPLLIDYWCRVLLGHQTYQGALLVAHRHVHEQQAFEADHFDRWYGLWAMTIDQGWAGPLAEKAKSHAARIAGSLARQLPGITWEPAPPATCPTAV